MPDLNALILFAKVVEARSFSEAARRLNMPVSTVSRRIAELEDQLGARLLERSTRALRLTDVGAEALEHARRIQTISEALDGHVSDRLPRVEEPCGSRPRPASPTRCCCRSSMRSRRCIRMSACRSRSPSAGPTMSPTASTSISMSAR